MYSRLTSLFNLHLKIKCFVFFKTGYFVNRPNGFCFDDCYMKDELKQKPGHW